MFPDCVLRIKKKVLFPWHLGPILDHRVVHPFAEHPGEDGLVPEEPLYPVNRGYWQGLAGHPAQAVQGGSLVKTLKNFFFSFTDDGTKRHNDNTYDDFTCNNFTYNDNTFNT